LLFAHFNGRPPRPPAPRGGAHLAAVGLPNDLASAGVEADGAALAAHMAHDKKVRGGKLPLILTRGIGQSFVTDEFGLKVVGEFLERERTR
ncbi:MAG: 3-dehydroquinate synthase, partial [Sphingopyxis sp.]|nr:3-dehydroquinate synthase [Sphingopyxis sp.]